MNTLRCIFTACLTILVFAIADDARAQEPAEDHHDHADEPPAGHVDMDAATLTEFGIETAIAGSAVLRERRALPGEVRANQDRVAHIVPRFAGVVKEVRARTGDEVKAGQTLALIESDESLTDFGVKTLLGGTVIERHLTLGEAVSRDEHVFVIADLDTVWIDIAVYLRDIERVSEGMPVSVSCGRHDEFRSARVAYVSPVVDENTRTGTARVILPNHDRHWRPGMFVTAEIETAAFEVPVAVPASALFTIDGQATVFTRTPDGFAPRSVTLGRTADEMVEIVAGLVAGEEFVARGGFTLKAELEKSSFGDGHAH